MTVRQLYMGGYLVGIHHASCYVHHDDLIIYIPSIALIKLASLLPNQEVYTLDNSFDLIIKLNLDEIATDKLIEYLDKENIEYKTKF